MEKKLKRSNNKMIAGVAAGIAEYFDLDVTLVRIIWAILVLGYGTGILIYIICMIFMDKS